MSENKPKGKGSIFSENRYEVSQGYMRHLEKEPSGVQGTQQVAVKNEVKGKPGIQGTQHVAVKTEEGNEPEARNRYFWLGEGASSDPRIHMMYPETESVESSDIDSETSETSSDVFAEFARDFPELAAEIEAESREEDRKRAAETTEKVTGPHFL